MAQRYVCKLIFETQFKSDIYYMTPVTIPIDLKQENQMLSFKMSRVGSNIKKLRALKGMNQMHLAFLAGLSERTISRIEKDTLYDPKLSTLLKISTVFNISLAQLTSNSMG